MECRLIPTMGYLHGLVKQFLEFFYQFVFFRLHTTVAVYFSFDLSP